ncbi:LOB domain-containing protein 11-like [Humulus lupulus]|uniref:LOB domain-containing protein 11-like n=1 Tax=Humulus lupulus TaxID=3486 RepID=UPI002B40A128|nr:LOB domain-containing protein 11-like [Humulus lupulus]
MEPSTDQAPIPRARLHQPCAACRMLRRRCDRNCLLSPYFPPEEIENFAGVHKVFGASNIIKMIQMVEETKRDDTVKSIVYEATARMRDPVYGCAGTIFHLQKMVSELRSQLETTTAQVMDLQEERDKLLGLLMNNAQYYVDFDPSTTTTTQWLDPVFDGCTTSSIYDSFPF